ncbi:unnamed protein product, partial [marine sediment metagenome]
MRTQIDEQNKNLETTMDKLRGLENVMMIINSIEDLSKENGEASKNITICNQDIEGYNSQVDGVQKKVDEVQQIINSMHEDKNKELDHQKRA